MTTPDDPARTPAPLDLRPMLATASDALPTGDAHPTGDALPTGDAHPTGDARAPDTRGADARAELIGDRRRERALLWKGLLALLLVVALVLARQYWWV